MSAPEHDGQVEQKSSIKVVRNAKGEPQFEAKIVQGSTDGELTDLRRQAVEMYTTLTARLTGAAQ